MRSEHSAHSLACVLAEGEGQKIEFKEGLSRIEREIVAFANATGGSLYIGVRDDGRVAGISTSNKVLSEIQTMTRNCDPPVPIRIIRHEDVLEVAVEEGTDKPYRCREGFFLRLGANCQKLRRDEIRNLMAASGRFHFDEQPCAAFSYPDDFSSERFEQFLREAEIHHRVEPEEILLSLDLASVIDEHLTLTNTAVLFFAERPQHWLKESHITCVRYQGTDRLSIIDRQEIRGNPLSMIDQALVFLRRHVQVRYKIGAAGKREEQLEYPLPVLREALVNAVTHRDYFYDASHTYVHIYSDRIEIENPGGLYGGLTVAELGKRSVRRNCSIADLMFRAGYIEQVGSGIPRIRQELEQNGNPPFELTATNFFIIRLLPALPHAMGTGLSERQRKILAQIEAERPVTKRQLADALGVSDDTILRDLSTLMEKGLVQRSGVGRAIRYS